MTGISFSQIRGKFVLILGEVGAGKTSLTLQLMEEAIEKGARGITVIDMAPKVINVDGGSVGGLLLEKPDPRVRYMAPREISAPRLTARNAEELLEFADKNKSEIEALLNAFSMNPSEVLFVNDVSIYLQRGELDRLLGAFSMAETVVANGYLGERLRGDFGTGVSLRERDLVLKLADKMDEVIRL